MSVDDLSSGTEEQRQALSDQVARLHGPIAPTGGGAPVQMRRAEGGASAAPDRVHATAQRGVQGSGSTLPFRDIIQARFGRHDVSTIRAHTGGTAAEASRGIGASAYAMGESVAFARAPDLHTAAHEAAHVIQQRAGVSLSGGVGQSGDHYERQADAVADAVVRGVDASRLLGGSLSSWAPGEAALAPGRAPVVQMASLTSEIAMEDGEPEAFAAALAVLGITLSRPDKVFKAARTKLLSGDPRMHTLAGTGLDVDGTWPTAELIARVCAFQKGKKAAVTGVPSVALLRRMLMEKHQTHLIAEHRDLFGTISGRSATDGQKAEKAEHRAEYAAHTEPFLGMGWTAGVNDEMWAALQRAEAYLLDAMGKQIDQDPTRVHPGKGAPLTKTTADLRHWVGIRERHRGFKAGQEQGYHKTGSAMDLNYHTNPWMGVRSGNSLGGEAVVSGKVTMQREAIDVIDRASLWMHGRRAELQVSMRPRTTDPEQLRAWVAGVWQRLNSASEAVASYFALGFDIDREAKLAELAKQNEQLVADGKGKEEGTGALLQYKSVLSSMRLRAEEEALARITESMGRGRPWSKDPAVVFKRMLPDLQAVALTMVRGNVSSSPKDVRNPALGLFDLKKELVEALVVHGGLYWGACEFGKTYSGDMMHFDLGRVPRALK